MNRDERVTLHLAKPAAQKICSQSLHFCFGWDSFLGGGRVKLQFPTTGGLEEETEGWLLSACGGRKRASVLLCFGAHLCVQDPAVGGHGWVPALF